MKQKGMKQKSTFKNLYQKSKKWFLKVDEQVDHVLTTPIPEIIYQALKLQIVVDKISAKVYLKYPSLKGHICRSKRQKTVAFVAAWMVLLVICLMTGTSVNPLVLYNSIPFLDMSNFMTQTAQAANSIVAYWFMLVWVIAVDTGIIKLFHRYITGDDNDRFLSVNGFLEWSLNLYLCAVTGALATPAAVWYAFHASDANGWIKYLSAPGILALISVILLSLFFIDSLENIGSIYLSVLFFKIFSTLKISFIFSFIIEAVQYLTHMRSIDTVSGISLCFVAIMQVVFNHIKNFKFYQKFVKLLQFLCTTIAGLFCLTIGLVISMVMCVIVLYIKYVIG